MIKAIARVPIAVLIIGSMVSYLTFHPAGTLASPVEMDRSLPAREVPRVDLKDSARIASLTAQESVSHGGAAFVPGELIVGFSAVTSDPTLAIARASAALQAYGATATHHFRSIDAWLVKVPVGTEVEQARLMVENGIARFAEPNYLVHTVSVGVKMYP